MATSRRVVEFKRNVTQSLIIHPRSFPYSFLHKIRIISLKLINANDFMESVSSCRFHSSHSIDFKYLTERSCFCGKGRLNKNEQSQIACNTEVRMMEHKTIREIHLFTFRCRIWACSNFYLWFCQSCMRCIWNRMTLETLLSSDDKLSDKIKTWKTSHTYLFSFSISLSRDKIKIFRGTKFYTFIKL